jgi:hypothetical protein
MKMKEKSKVAFKPLLSDDDNNDSYRHLNDLIHSLKDLPKPDAVKKLRRAGRETPMSEATSLRASLLLLADLLEHGWSVEVESSDIWLKWDALRSRNGRSLEVKAELRMALLAARNRQLQEKSVKAFISKMERRRIYGGRSVSVLDLVDDGNELARKLKTIAALPASEQEQALGRVIQPVIQACDSNAVCEYTGLRLQDIWRYFRHTWSLEYRALPGRRLCLLIRNAARPLAPVMGIAMLANGPTALRPRDKWIGCGMYRH